MYSTFCDLTLGLYPMNNDGMAMVDTILYVSITGANIILDAMRWNQIPDKFVRAKTHPYTAYKIDS